MPEPRTFRSLLVELATCVVDTTDDQQTAGYAKEFMVSVLGPDWQNDEVGDDVDVIPNEWAHLILEPEKAAPDVDVVLPQRAADLWHLTVDGAAACLTGRTCEAPTADVGRRWARNIVEIQPAAGVGVHRGPCPQGHGRKAS